MNSNTSVWNKSNSLIEKIKINEENNKIIEAELLAKKEALANEEKKIQNIMICIERDIVRKQLKNKQKDEERASYRMRIPYAWRDIYDYCDTRSNGKMFKDFIIAAFKSNKLHLVNQIAILRGTEAVIEEAKKHKIKF